MDRDDKQAADLAGEYADTVVCTPFNGLTTKADARQFAIDAWTAGFTKALAMIAALTGEGP